MRLSGWVQNSRQLGGVHFLALRDQHGVTQLKVDPEVLAGNAAAAAAAPGSSPTADLAALLPPETVVTVRGVVTAQCGQERDGERRQQPQAVAQITSVAAL